MDKAQAHYLFGVMRQSVGASVLLFNGIDGEWRAEVAEAGKRGGVLACAEQTKPLHMPPDLWLIFAPIKKARTDFIVEKAAEMGRGALCRCKVNLPTPAACSAIVCKPTRSRQRSNAAGLSYQRWPIWSGWTV